MELKECGHGHIYDASLYYSCPYCASRNRAINFEQYAGTGGSNSTPVKRNEPDEIGKTVPVYNVFKREEKVPAEKTAPVEEKPQMPEQTDPVAGWLVCISGTNRGKNYCLFEKNNYLNITTGEGMRVETENNISSDQVRIDYDRKHQDFYLFPAPAGLITPYLNDEIVDMPKRLSAYDRIELDTTKYVFVPFCSRNFSWDRVDNEGNLL